MKRLFEIIFVVSLLFFYPIQLAFAQDILQEAKKLDMKQQNSKQELNNYNQNLINELEKQNSSKSNSQESSQTSMTLSNYLTDQDSIVSQLAQQFQTLTLQMAALQSYSNDLTVTNEQLNNIVLDCKKKIESLENNLQQFKEALISNKADTAIILEQIGEMQQAIDYYKSLIAKFEGRLHRATIMSELQLPAMFASGIVTGIGMYAWNDGKDYGKYMTFAGLGCFMSFEIIYNAGHFTFKWW